MEEQGLIEKVVDEYFLTEKGKSLNKLIYDLVEFTLDNNSEYYEDETVIKAKEGFKKQLLE
jgi:DNA-binding HxlR family transcriptional regulator